MENGKNISSYTAADFEKYWNGRLTSAEMHAIEKAALEDPFLADALEGFKYSQQPVAETEDLKRRIQERLSGKQNKPVLFSWKNSRMKAAAAIIIISVAGILISQLVIKKDESQVAVQEENQDPPIVQNPGDTSTIQQGHSQAPENRNTTTVKTEKKPTSPTLPDNNNLNETQVVKTASGIRLNQQDPGQAGMTRGKKTQPAVKHTFLFNGTIRDPMNQPVPFANILNLATHASTYTDLNGQFAFSATDSVVDIEVRSQGFDTIAVRLKHQDDFQNILLPRNRNTAETYRPEVKQYISSRARSENRQPADPEPESGWELYDLYIFNNLNIPAESRQKMKEPAIQLHFKVNDSGYPEQITVTNQTGCSVCEAEAIRLLKVGPKWKSSEKNTETTVSINVDK